MDLSDHCLWILTVRAVLIYLVCEEAHLEVVLDHLVVVLVDHLWVCRPWEHLGRHGLLILNDHVVLFCDLVYEEANLEVVLVDHILACRPWEHLGHHIPA